MTANLPPRGPLERDITSALHRTSPKESPLAKEDKACADEAHKGLPTDEGASESKMKDILLWCIKQGRPLHPPKRRPRLASLVKGVFGRHYPMEGTSSSVPIMLPGWWPCIPEDQDRRPGFGHQLWCPFPPDEREGEPGRYIRRPPASIEDHHSIS